MKKSPYVLVLFLSLCLATLTGYSDVAPTSGGASDWPQWRGLNRDAVSPETGLLEKWPEGGPEVAWRIGVGAGYSSVSVSDGKLYTQWDEGEMQFLVCLDARTGKELWRQALGSAFTNYHGDGPRSTPLIDDGIVYAVGTSGRLVAANQTTGEVLWTHNLVKEYASDLPTYGYSSSPLVVGDKLIVEGGGKDAAYLAFHKKTGKGLWASQNERPAYTSPISISIDGARQIVFWSAHGLRAVSPDDGSVLWKYDWNELCPVTGDPLNAATPVFVGPDRLFLSSGSGAALIRIAQSGGKFAVEEVWKSHEMRNDMNTSVLVGDYLYGFDRGILKCLDVRTGEIRWKGRGFQKGSLLAVDGQLIVLGEEGRLGLVAASPEAFVEKASVSVLKGRCWTAPSLAGGRLYLRNHEELIALDVKG